MKKSKGLVFFLSFVPGVGQYYLGLMQRGLQFNLLFFGLIVFSVVSGLGILNVFLPVIWFYALFDALRMADELNLEGKCADRPLIPWSRLPLRAPVVGWVLIIMGIYAFLSANRFFYWHRIFPRELHLDNLLVALALVGFGIRLLVGRKNGNGVQKKGEEV